LSGEFTNIFLTKCLLQISHHLQYPPGTTKILSYFESRGGKFSHIVFFGLQYIIKRWLCQPVTAKMVKEADEFFDQHFGSKVFNREGWDYIVKEHGGKLPLLIKAVPEGTRVPVKNVLFTVENTDFRVPWVIFLLASLAIMCFIYNFSRFR
jgi:nicotinamide phosphoribosyltransferase